MKTRSNFDAPQNDLFGNEFIKYFSSLDIKPSLLYFANSAKEEIFAQFDPKVHPFMQDEISSRLGWTKLWSLYTNVSMKLSDYFQSDPLTFPFFTNGDESIFYLHCVFVNHPSLETVLGTMPRTALIEYISGRTDYIHHSCTAEEDLSDREKARWRHFRSG